MSEMRRRPDKPDYLTDGMLPHEYEPARTARRDLYKHTDGMLSDYSSYFAGKHEALGRYFYLNILHPFRALDFGKALDGVVDFEQESDPSGTYAYILDVIYRQIEQLQQLEITSWFPGGYADINDE